MKVPFSWLKELVDIDVTAQELEEKLFSCGFEVEELIPLDAGISKVVVGKIVEIDPSGEWLMMDFDGRSAAYSLEMLSEVDLASVR